MEIKKVLAYLTKNFHTEFWFFRQNCHELKFAFPNMFEFDGGDYCIGQS